MPAQAVMRFLEHVWETLAPQGRPMAVMGGIALSAWKHIRATQDVDLLVAMSEADARSLLATLQAAKINPKRDPPLVTLGETQFLQLQYEPLGTFLLLQIDLLFANSEFSRSALARRSRVTLPELAVDVDVVSCEDLIIYKVLAGRILDRVDASYLLRHNRPTLDLSYLVRWVNQLAILDKFVEIWHEALPDEGMPTSDVVIPPTD